jgi:hypothetical protein
MDVCILPLGTEAKSLPSPVCVGGRVDVGGVLGGGAVRVAGDLTQDLTPDR